MKLLLSLIFLIGFLSFSSQATTNEADFFKPKACHFGVYYYPEHWSEDQWERDIKRISELGFDFIHLAEFAWQRMEPAEGQYDFSWLDRVVELCAKYHLKVLMCTPSPCIPAWLATKHPEVLLVNSDGQRIFHNGARLTGSLANPIYQEYVRKIVTKIAERYGPDERIFGWQIGNEPHIQTGCDYSPSAEQAYVKWLKNKYGTIDQLNHSWGGPFWSFSYSSFDEIRVPMPSIPGPNPHASLDFQLYTGDEIARDLNDQTKLLRKHTRKQQWITTNYAAFKDLQNVNPFLTRKDLDFSSYTMYLTSNRKNSSGDSLAHRLGSGMELCFSHEMAKSTNGYTGIMELQPGQINWGKFNSMPQPGAVRMWVWHSFGMGDRFTCTYRYRQPLYGTEQFHHGIMQSDGVTVSQGGNDFIQAVKEIRDFSKQLEPQAENDFVRKTRTGFLWSNRNMIDLQSYRHHQDWDSWQHIYTYYQGLKRMGVDVQFISEQDEFSVAKNPFMVVPAYQMMSHDLITKLEAYVNDGGHLIISTRSGLKDSNGHLWEMKIQQPIWKLIGGQVEYYDHLPQHLVGMISFKEKSYAWHTWGTIVTASADTSILGTYSDQFYHGKSAILQRRMGKGSTTYVGAWSDQWEMEYQLLRHVYGEVVGSLPFDLPPYVFAHFRDGVWVAVNYTDKMVSIPVPSNAKILLGESSLPPAGVLVWRETK